MKWTKYRWILPIMLILMTLALRGSCTEVAGGSNYTLGGDNPVDGTLFIAAQNARLVEGASMDGSVVMLCCDLIVEAEITGDVFLLTGNLSITSSADVGGNAYVITGNLSK